MSIAKPYYRIWRPFPNDDLFENDYALDPRNAADAIDLIRGYHLLEEELFRLFDFIEPADANLSAYSHQLYALLLRASTEFEANAKGILRANGYARAAIPTSLTITSSNRRCAYPNTRLRSLFGKAIIEWFNRLPVGLPVRRCHGINRTTVSSITAPKSLSPPLC